MTTPVIPTGRRWRKRKATEKEIHQDIREIIPESLQYFQLLEFEKHLDACTMRKRVDIQDALKRPQKYTRTLRVFISNTASSDVETGDEPQVTLRIEGRLLEPKATDKARGGRDKILRKFSSFLSRTIVEFDKNQYPGSDNIIEWQRSSTTTETDGFEINRMISIPTHSTILLYLEHAPAKYKLDKHLADILDLHTATRPSVILGLWEYIKSKNLQNEQNPENINCDAYLRRIFRKDTISLLEIPALVDPLLLPAEPVRIEFDIDPFNPRPRAVYDIDVETDDMTKTQMNTFLLTQQTQKSLQVLEEKIQLLTKQIKKSREKREFMLLFAEDPQKFIQKWASSQSHDYAEISVAGGLTERERTADTYCSVWAQEAVLRYYSSKLSVRRAELQAQTDEYLKNPNPGS